MAWEDRDYYREGPRFSTRLGRGSVVTWLLVINVVVFMLDTILFGSERAHSISPSWWGHFSVDAGVYGFQFWRFFTYQFLHGDFFHLLFNMIGLFFFGPLMERWWGSRRFIVFYLLCGLAGAALFSVALPIIPGGATATPLVGASACVTGVVMGAAVLWPKQKVMLLFPPVPMPLWVLAAIFIGFDVLAVGVGSGKAGGAVAHLGGAVLGFGLIKLPKLLDWADRFSPGAIQRGINDGRMEKKRKQAEAQEADLDRVLAKVKEHGLHSLSKKEKKVLQRATEDRGGK